MSLSGFGHAENVLGVVFDIVVITVVVFSAFIVTILGNDTPPHDAMLPSMGETVVKVPLSSLGVGHVENVP